MARIMIRCPRNDKAVPTGLKTELVNLESMSIPIDSVIVKMTVLCPACKRMHDWTYKDAWIEEK